MRILPRLPGPAVVAALLAATLAFAGCAGADGNDPPKARLEADRTQGGIGDTFAFDGSSSRDPDGNITAWAFDFGDGNHTTVDAPDEPRVTHSYTVAGSYNVTLAVVDDGDGNGTRPGSDEDSLRVTVDDRFAVVGQVAAVDSPTINMTSDYTRTWMVGDGASSAHLAIEVQSLLPDTPCRILLEIRGPDGVAASQESTLQGASNQTLKLDAPLSGGGPHELRISAREGGATFAGNLTTTYR